VNAEKLQIQLTESCGIFDAFKNMASLEEDICKKITECSKKEFVRF
jgi:hypothetical protein